MWKRLNKILHDKNDYHLDPSLKAEVEISDELLRNTIKYQKYLIPRKVKYFLKFDKWFFARLLAKYFLKFSIGVVILGVILLVAALGFGININFKKIQKIHNNQCAIYIPSTGDLELDEKTINLYKKEYGENVDYIIFYLTDPSKNYEKWKQGLCGIESKSWDNPYEARRPNSQFWGKYQMGELARKSVKLSDITWDKWKTNPELQEAAMRMWVDILYQSMKSDIKKYDGKFLNGWGITESGIIAMAHNVGPDATSKFLASGGKNVPKDGSGKDATRFLILGNYNLEVDRNSPKESTTKETTKKKE